MKEYLAELVRACPTPALGVNVAREYLQARILGCLQRAGAMIPLALQGGTALRFLYANARYSEDLYFALARPGPQYDFRAYQKVIRAELAAEGYPVELRVNDQLVFHNAYLRFGGLLYELGLSSREDQVLLIKIEVDTNPSPGAALTTTVVRRHVTLQLQHHDRASLLAGKLYDILQSPYLSGRDLYDLLWYLRDPDWPQPNLTLLNHSLKHSETGWAGPSLTEDNWRGILGDQLGALPWDRVAADVRPFLEPSVDLDVLTFENVMRALEGGPAYDRSQNHPSVYG